MRIGQSLLLVAVCLMITPWAQAAESPGASDLTAELEAAKERITSQQDYQLRYRFAAGETIRWKVVHLGTTETKIQGNTQTSKSRSVSTKQWHVTGVEDDGSITLTHSVEAVEMWQKLSDRPEISYNSKTDQEPPAEYQHVAKSVGQPLTTVSIRPDGTVLERDDETRQVKFGVGEIVMLLPPKPVRVGSRWFEPSEIQTRVSSGRVKRIKTRKVYQLEKVLTGVATISVKTEVLTPVNDAEIEAQLVQQLTEGTIKFDVDAGRVLSKQMDWDETVVGFNGADSMMKYLARFTEELLPADTTTAQSSSPEKEEDPASSAESVSAARADVPTVRRR